jgi:hypothetical protein
VPTYTFDGGGIMPVCLGLIFDSDQHAIAMPDGRTLSTAGGIPRWYPWRQGFGIGHE